MKSKLAGFRVHGGMYGVEIIAMLLKLIPESRTLWCIRVPRVGLRCGLASNRRLKAVPNTHLKAGLQGFDRSLEMYCRLSCWRRRSGGSSPYIDILNRVFLFGRISSPSMSDTRH